MPRDEGLITKPLWMLWLIKKNIIPNDIQSHFQMVTLFKQYSWVRNQC